MRPAAARVTAALRLSDEDSATIDELKKQVERTWGLLEASTKREEAANDVIQRLQEEKDTLQTALQKTAQLVGGSGGATIEQVVAQRDMLVAKVRETEALVAHERGRADELVRDLTRKQEKYKEQKAVIKEMERQLAAKAAEEARDAKKRSSLETEANHLREQLAQKVQAADALKRLLDEAEEKASGLEKQLAAQRHTMTTSLNEFQRLHKDTAKLAGDLEEQVRAVSLLREEKTAVEKELRLRVEETARERAAVARLTAKGESDARERDRVMRLLDDEKSRNEALRSELASYEKLADQEAIRTKATERTIARLDRERSTAEKRAAVVDTKLSDARLEIDGKLEDITALEADNRRLTAEASKMRGVIAVLERDRDRIRAQVEEVEKQLTAAHDEIRDRELSLMEVEGRVTDISAKLKQGQSAYEHLKTEKLALQKDLAQALDDVAELKRKTKVQGNQIEQLKGEVHAKDRALVAEEFVSARHTHAPHHAGAAGCVALARAPALHPSMSACCRVVFWRCRSTNPWRSGWSSAATRWNSSSACWRRRTLTSRSRTLRLATSTQRSGGWTRRHWRKSAHMTRSSRSATFWGRSSSAATTNLRCCTRSCPFRCGSNVCAGVQPQSVACPSPAHAPLLCCAGMQASRLSKGEAQYKDRLQDIRLLRLKVADQKRELAIASASAGASTELRKELARLQRDLLTEQSRVKALSDELENPINVHRWRKLGGTDPAAMDLVEKVATLQRRLIAKTTEVAERDAQLAEKERMYVELKAMLARQPGPEIAEALTHYQHLLAERTRQLKALASETQMYQAQVGELKFETERLTKQLIEAKRQYFELRNKEKMAGGATGGAGTDAGSDFAMRAAEAQRAAAAASVPRFVGGGFAVSLA